jgi:uncharacterized protein (TIGR02466 family)
MKINLFSVDIWKSIFPDVNYLSTLTNQDLLSRIDLVPPESVIASGVTTSAWADYTQTDQLHHWPEFKPLADTIEGFADHIWEELEYYDDATPQICQSWITVGKRDAMILPHIHYNAHLSAVVYISASPEQGNIVFESPMEMALIGQPIKNKIKRVRREISVVSGDVIIFPGYLKHYTMPNKTNEPRITFVANLNSTGKLK